MGAVLFRRLPLCGIMLFFFACGTTVHLTGSWKANDASAVSYHNILIASLSSNMAARQTVESNLVAALQKRGIVAGRSLDLFPPNFDSKNETSKSEMAGKIRAAGYNAVLTTSLVNKESEQRYVPGTMTDALQQAGLLRK